ncbi:Uncharacterised protein [Vibrio anguillarum]|nr:Uncharacterised protein [Vibrio anguillarum]
MAKRRTNKEWQTLFEKYQSSHLSQRVFCERNELSLSTFMPNASSYKQQSQPISVALLKQKSLKKRLATKWLKHPSPT